MTRQLPIEDRRTRRPLPESHCVKRPRASPKTCLNQLPTELHSLLLEAIRGPNTGPGAQPPRQQPVLRLQSLRRMRSLLHAVLCFEVFLGQYADIVKEVDVLYPAHDWDILEYHDRSTHSPVLLRTIARSSASCLRILRLPSYQFEGTETILPTVFEECTQLEVLAFDDGGHIDDHIGKLLAASNIAGLTVNRPSIPTMDALRDGLCRLKILRLHMLDRSLINHLRSLLMMSCLSNLEHFSLELSDKCGAMVETNSADDHADKTANTHCELRAFLDDLGAHLVRWLPMLRILKMRQTSNHIGRSDTHLRRTDVDAVNRMAASIVASRAPGTRNGCSHEVTRMVHLSAASSTQLQRMKKALRDVCRSADVRLDISGYGVFIPMKLVQHGDESPRDYVVSRVNMRPAIITRVFGGSESPDDEYREFSMLEEVFIHLDKIMTHYSSQLWAFWCTCGSLVRKASVRCCAENKRKEVISATEEDKDAEQQRRERMDLMIFHMTVTLKNLKIFELSVCALADTKGNAIVVPKWMRRMYQRECLAEVRHLNVVVCECDGAAGAFLRLCTSILEMFCQLPRIESVHMLRGGRASIQNMGVEQLEDAARGVQRLTEKYAEVSLAGVAAALREWRGEVQCTTVLNSSCSVGSSTESRSACNCVDHETDCQRS